MDHFKELKVLREQLRFLIDSSGHDKTEIGKLLDETREEYHKRVDDGSARTRATYNDIPFDFKPPTCYKDGRLDVYLHTNIDKVGDSEYIGNAIKEVYNGILRMRKLNTLEIPFKPIDAHAFHSYRMANRICDHINTHVKVDVHSGSVKDGIKVETVEKENWSGRKYTETTNSFPIPITWKHSVYDKELHLTDISGKTVMTLEAKPLPEEEQKWLEEDIRVYKAKVARVSYKQEKRPGYWSQSDGEYEILDRYIAQYTGTADNDRNGRTDTGLSYKLCTSTTANRAASVLKSRIEKVLCKDIWDD
ncbi:hypothetical protein N9N32_00300 [Alphaproteobacteria bacterium]|nr:hypothetical protein [Alphaproteobacteria bacterium]